LFCSIIYCIVSCLLLLPRLPDHKLKKKTSSDILFSTGNRLSGFPQMYIARVIPTLNKGSVIIYRNLYTHRGVDGKRFFYFFDIRDRPFSQCLSHEWVMSSSGLTSISRRQMFTRSTFVDRTSHCNFSVTYANIVLHTNILMYVMYVILYVCNTYIPLYLPRVLSLTNKLHINYVYRTNLLVR